MIYESVYTKYISVSVYQMSGLLFLVWSEGDTQTQIRRGIRANIKTPLQSSSRGFIWLRDETQIRRHIPHIWNEEIKLICGRGYVEWPYGIQVGAPAIHPPTWAIYGPIARKLYRVPSAPTRARKPMKQRCIRINSYLNLLIHYLPPQFFSGVSQASKLVANGIRRSKNVVFCHFSKK